MFYSYNFLSIKRILGRRPGGPDGQDRLIDILDGFRQVISQECHPDVSQHLTRSTTTGTTAVIQVFVFGHTRATVHEIGQQVVFYLHPWLAMTVTTAASAPDQSVKELEPFLKLR